MYKMLISKQIDPFMRSALEEVGRMKYAPRDFVGDIDEARRITRQIYLHRAVETPLVNVEDLIQESAFGNFTVRVFTPVNDGGAVVAPFVHGGGWCAGDVESYDPLLRRIAAASNAVVLGIDYGLAPENPFPRAIEQILDCLRSLRAGGQLQRYADRKIVLVGDSSGANIALSTAMSVGREALQIHGLALLYGVFDCNFDTESYRAFSGGEFGLTDTMMETFFDLYTQGDHALRLNPRVSPLRGDIGVLPNTFLVAAGLDCLRDDTLGLAKALSDAGSPYTLTVVPGVVHGFARFLRDLPQARQTVARLADFIRVIGASDD